MSEQGATATNGNGRSIKDRAVDWLFNQPISTILLLLILYGCYRLVNEGIPAGITQIQQGYERAEQKHTIEREQQQLRHAEERKQANDKFLDALKQVERGQVGSTPEGE